MVFFVAAGWVSVRLLYDFNYSVGIKRLLCVLFVFVVEGYIGERRCFCFYSLEFIWREGFLDGVGKRSG